MHENSHLMACLCPGRVLGGLRWSAAARASSPTSLRPMRSSPCAARRTRVLRSSLPFASSGHNCMQSTYRSVPAGVGTPTSVFSAVTVKLKEPPNRFSSDLSDADLADLAGTQAASADGEECTRDVRDGMLATPNEAHLAHLTRTPTVRAVAEQAAQERSRTRDASPHQRRHRYTGERDSR